MLLAMSVRRVLSLLSVCLVASVTVVVAQPAKKDPKTPVAPAKESAPADPGSATPAAGADEGSAVQMVEDAPADMEGTNEDPDAPRTGGESAGSVTAVAVPAKQRTSGYPIEEVLRPITLPANMSEVSLAPHAQVSPYTGSDALRARYGITRQAQLGLTYVLGGIYNDPGTVSDKTGFHPGKAVGLDVTVLLQDWIGVKVGVPVYIDPVAVGLTLGAPMKFRFGEKLAIGGLDDLVNISLYRFHPSFYQEAMNALGATNFENNTTQSRGSMRFSGFAVYQQSPKLALIGRLGVVMEDFATTRGDSGYGGISTFIRAGIQYTVRKYLDLGASLGFDDLARAGSFSPQLYGAVRI
jgi:hypothetical protein